MKKHPQHIPMSPPHQKKKKSAVGSCTACDFSFLTFVIVIVREMEGLSDISQGPWGTCFTLQLYIYCGFGGWEYLAIFVNLLLLFGAGGLVPWAELVLSRLCLLVAQRGLDTLFVCHFVQSGVLSSCTKGNQLDVVYTQGALWIWVFGTSGKMGQCFDREKAWGANLSCWLNKCHSQQASTIAKQLYVKQITYSRLNGDLLIVLDVT